MFNRQITVVLQGNFQDADNVSIGSNGGIFAAGNGNNQAIGQSAGNAAQTSVAGNTLVL
jgi:hypothetical protein